MGESLLLLDLGNTRLKWVWSDGHSLDTSRSGACKHQDMGTEFVSGPLAEKPDHILLSTVVRQSLKDQLLAMLPVDIPLHEMITKSEEAGLINGYDQPEQLGVDRWLAMLGAMQEYDLPAVVVDAGTATTLDAINEEGWHLGGWIIPGSQLMAESLSQGTGHLPVATEPGQHFRPGCSTRDGIATGIQAAQCSVINQFYQSVSSQQEKNPKLVVTGGAAQAIIPGIEQPVNHDPWLVYRGMLVSWMQGS